MKLNSTAPDQFFFKPTLPSMGAPWRSSIQLRPRRVTPRPSNSPELDDILGHKQEIICAVILALCLLAALGVCLCNLAAR